MANPQYQRLSDRGITGMNIPIAELVGCDIDISKAELFTSREYGEGIALSVTVVAGNIDTAGRIGTVATFAKGVMSVMRAVYGEHASPILTFDPPLRVQVCSAGQSYTLADVE